MIYPKNFEHKIEFDKIRSMLDARCLTSLGKSAIVQLNITDNADEINCQLDQIRQFKQLEDEYPDFSIGPFTDLREQMKRIRLEGTFFEPEELWDLKKTLITTTELVRWFKSDLSTISLLEKGNSGNIDYKNRVTEKVDASSLLSKIDQSENTILYPALYALTEGVIIFPSLIQQIDLILDKFGNIKDTASPDLQRIRRELNQKRSSISGILNNILQSAQKEGLIDKDVTPTMRDGRLVIPVAPGLKRKIQGIIHDESDSGKTVFIEPSDVVEANNKIRELQSEEHHEMVRILKEITKQIRPHLMEILYGFKFLERVDLIQAKVKLSRFFRANEPKVIKKPSIDWIQARHPLLEKKLSKVNLHTFAPTLDGKDRNDSTTSPGFSTDNNNELTRSTIVPLDISLTEDQRVLVISGPNAGGKSVCLKTVGLLQYMLQCGLSIPINERSKCGVFHNIMIDIGDEQSIDDDLSTYSSHLTNMKNMIRHSDSDSLILIDEFGTGTEPQIGGAIAESVLEQFCKNNSWAVITTHYKNLKDFATTHKGVVNGAMLYDRNKMQPLFQLSIGNPGSSFAIDIARKIGLPDEVIQHASKIVGDNYVQSDKFLQDIARDKRYWENKRQTIHQREKELQDRLDLYEKEIQKLKDDRKKIIIKAKNDAEELLKESNKKIENAIREIRENQAERMITKKIRKELEDFHDEINNETWQTENRKKEEQEAEINLQKKIDQIQQRRERREKRKQDKAKEKLREVQEQEKLMQNKEKKAEAPLVIGDIVNIKGLTSIGKIESIEGSMCTIIVGNMHTKLRLSRLERNYQIESKDPNQDDASPKPRSKADERKESLQVNNVSQMTRDTIDERRQQFKQDIDVRGMRGDEALNAVQYFIDDAILMGVSRVRILHGKGNGILRQLIHQYLGTIPNVTQYKDEHVQFGGAGITVVDIA